MLTSLKTKPSPTEEQLAVLEQLVSTDDNILEQAYAGCGKTSMLKMQMWKSKEKPILYMAFNKPVVDEAKREILAGDMPDWVSPRTFNSLGLGVLKDMTGKPCPPDTYKMSNLMKEEFKRYKREDRDELEEAYFDIRQALGLAKHLGYVPDGYYPEVKRLCDRGGLADRLDAQLTPLQWAVVDNVLVTSIKAAFAGSADFDDQIYLPALWGGPFPGFPCIYVDEDQDLDPANHAMLKHLMSSGSRLCAVGDRWQSIYYFRGAETNGVEKFKENYKMIEMPLSISFRCPSEIVRAVHWHVPHMRWLREGGTYASLSELDPADIPDGAAIICRNNAPLFRAAFALLHQRRSVRVAGSDIGPKIISLLQKIGNEADTRDALLLKIDAWRDEKLETANNTATILDTAECLKLFASWGATLNQAVGYARTIFSQQQGSIELTTGHKAKGKEWDVVYHLDKWLLKDDSQDRNLEYVITTRAHETLYEINTKEIPWLLRPQG
jgi:DNA helicase-2/ATP-dependent DNA helicase PcrA